MQLDDRLRSRSKPALAAVRLTETPFDELAGRTFERTIDDWDRRGTAKTG
jgi:hypothetical protein